MNGFGAYYEFQPGQTYSGFGGFAFGAGEPAVTLADATSTTAPTNSDGTNAPVTTLKDATSTAPATTSAPASAPTTIVVPPFHMPTSAQLPKLVKWGFIGLLGLAAFKTIMK